MWVFRDTSLSKDSAICSKDNINTRPPFHLSTVSNKSVSAKIKYDCVICQTYTSKRDVKINKKVRLTCHRNTDRSPPTSHQLRVGTCAHLALGYVGREVAVVAVVDREEAGGARVELGVGVVRSMQARHNRVPVLLSTPSTRGPKWQAGRQAAQK